MSKRPNADDENDSGMFYDPFDTRVAYKNNAAQRVPVPRQRRRSVPTVDPRAIMGGPGADPLTLDAYGEEQPAGSVSVDTITFIEGADDEPVVEGVNVSPEIEEAVVAVVQNSANGVADVTQNAAADAVAVVHDAIEDTAVVVSNAQNRMAVSQGSLFGSAGEPSDDSRAMVVYDGDAYLRDIASVKEQWMQIENGAVPVYQLPRFVADVMTRLHDMSNELGRRVDDLKELQRLRNQDAQNDMQMVVAQQRFQQLEAMQQNLQLVASTTSNALVNVRNAAIGDAVPFVANAQNAMGAYMAETDSDDEEMDLAMANVPSVESVASLQGGPLLRTLEGLADTAKSLANVVGVLSSKQAAQAEESATPKKDGKANGNESGKDSRLKRAERIRAKKREQGKRLAAKKAAREAKKRAAKEAQEKADEEKARELAREVVRESDALDAAAKASRDAALAKGRQGKEGADTEPVAQSRGPRPLSSDAGTPRSHTTQDPTPEPEPLFRMRMPDRRRGYTRLQDRSLQNRPRPNFPDDDDDDPYDSRSSPASRDVPAPRSVLPQGTEINEPFILVMAAIALLAIIKG